MLIGYRNNVASLPLWPMQLTIPLCPIYACFSILLIAFSAGASLQRLDQHYETSSPDHTIVAARFECAQTFTVGVDGWLSSVEVKIGRYSYTFDPIKLTLDIRRTIAGVPVEDDG